MNLTKYKKLWGILIVLIGLNIWLMYGKTNLQQQVNMLQAEVLQKTDSMISEPVRFTYSTDIFQNSVNLVTVFTDFGCRSCVIVEIEYLNEWNRTFPNTLKVFYLGTSKKYLEDLGAEFKYQKIESAQTLFSVALPIGNPITALVDENKYVQAIHTNDLTRPGSDQRRTDFYQRMRSLFESVHEKK